MKAAASLLIAAFLWIGPAASKEAASDRYLLSITNVPMTEEDHLEAIDVTMFGYRILAVCKVPPIWTITITGGIDPQTVIHGSTTAWMGNLAKDQLMVLQNAFLVEGDPEARVIEGSL